MIERLSERGRIATVRPSLAPPFQEWQGLLAMFCLIVFLDRYSNYVRLLSFAPLIYLIAVMLIACWCGLRAGLLSVALLVLYAWTIYHFPISAVVTNPARANVAVWSTALFFSPFALTAGIVQNKLRAAAVREFEARATANSESEQRRIAEAELWASEEMRRLIIHSSVDAVVGLGGDGTITMWNPNAERLLGWTQEEAIGSRAGLRIKPPSTSEPSENSLMEFFETGQGLIPRDHTELVVQTKSGEPISVELYAAEQQTAKGSVYIVFIRDISERKRSEQAIRDLNARLEERVAERTKQLEAVNEELLGFTYSVSHDLRAPLRAIVANSRLVCEEADGSLNADAMARLKRLEGNALKMAELIDNLLQYTRIGQAHLVSRDFDLTDMAYSIAEDLKSRGEGTIEIQSDLATQGDPEMIRMVLFNLMENAWKYHRPGVPPRIEVGKTSDGVFYVRDHGIGFDMKYEDKVWKPFERLHRDSEYPGTGIGLANSKRIIARHGGKIWTESVPGEGTTMYFELGSKKSAGLRTARLN